MSYKTISIKNSEEYKKVLVVVDEGAALENAQAMLDSTCFKWSL